MSEEFDIVGIGNAIVDILAYADESFLARNGLAKGAMTLIDEKKVKQLYKEMGAATECSGGSAANTIAGIASMGGKAAFIGKVADDQFGDTFRYDMKAQKVHFTTEPLKKKIATASCLVFVTGDHKGPAKPTTKIERTMGTYLGATREISKEDIDEKLIKNSKVTYLEGYLWDQQNAKDAISKAIRIAHDNNRKVAFTLSDVFCVERHRDEFFDLIENSIDILFANEHEIMALYKEENLKKIYAKIQGKCEIVAVTRSEKGSVIITKDEVHNIEPEPTTIYDVTGAGDLYASGLLYGYVKGYPIPKCGKLASLAAAEVLKYLGARPLTKLSELIKLL